MNATYHDADMPVFNETGPDKTYSEVRHFNGLSYIIEEFIKLSEFSKTIIVPIHLNKRTKSSYSGNHCPWF